MDTPTHREAANVRAFLDAPAQIGGHEMRPFSAATRAMFQDLQLVSFCRNDEAKKLTDLEAMEEAWIMIYLQTRPVVDAKRALRQARENRERWLEEVIWPFAETLPVSAFEDFMLWMAASVAAVKAADVEVAPKPKAPGGPAESPPPGNS